MPSLVWNVDLGIMWNRKTFPVSSKAEEAGQLRHWRLQQERKAALRLQGMVRRFGAQAQGTRYSRSMPEFWGENRRKL